MPPVGLKGKEKTCLMQNISLNTFFCCLKPLKQCIQMLEGGFQQPIVAQEINFHTEDINFWNLEKINRSNYLSFVEKLKTGCVVLVWYKFQYVSRNIYYFVKSPNNYGRGFCFF